jgi:hypothetical protein
MALAAVKAPSAIVVPWSLPSHKYLLHLIIPPHRATRDRPGWDRVSGMGCRGGAYSGRFQGIPTALCINVAQRDV